MNEHHSGGRVAIRLDGVPETMLMPLWNRAADAAGPDPLLIDPMATELVRRIDYDFRARFGKPSITHAIRARFSDELIREFLARRPAAQVVALGEGLETQFWRVDNGSVEWISVDLPEAIEVRRRLLPPHPRNILIEGSALDLAWRRVISTRAPVFVIAAGLLMYFERTQVVSLLRQLAEHCDGGELFFDTIPPWFSRKTLRGWEVTRNYTAPPMPFGLALGELAAFGAEIPGISVMRALTYAEPYPDRMRFFALISRIPWIKSRIAPGLIHCRFTSAQAVVP